MKHIRIGCICIILLLIGCQQPEVDITVNTQSITVGQQVYLTATVSGSDSNSSPWVYIWSAQHGTVPGDNQRSTVSYTAPDAAGMDNIQVIVTNGEQSIKGSTLIAVTANSSVIIDVIENSTPIVSDTPEIVPTPTEIVVTATTNSPTLTPTSGSPTVAPTETIPPTVDEESNASLIAYASDQDGDWDIYVVSSDGGSPINLTRNNGDWDKNPVWSPDGNYIAFESNRDGNYDIYIMNADGTSQRRLTNNNADDFAPTWSPDGTEIAFQTLRTGVNQIWSVDINSGGFPYPITSNKHQNYHPTWAPNGKKIAYFSTRDEGVHYIYVTDLTNSSETRLRGTGLGDRHPNWGSNGKIVFITQNNIAVMNDDGSGATVLLKTYGVEINPAWSSDSQSIVFETDFGNTVNTGVIHNIFTISQYGENIRQITNNESGTNSGQPDWHP